MREERRWLGHFLMTSSRLSMTNSATRAREDDRRQKDDDFHDTARLFDFKIFATYRGQAYRIKRDNGILTGKAFV